MPLSYAGYHHFIMMSLVSVNTIHLRCLFRMNPLVWCLRLMLQPSLGYLDATQYSFFRDEIYEQNQSLLFSPLSTFLIIAAMIYAPPGMTAFTSNVIGL